MDTALAVLILVLVLAALLFIAAWFYRRQSMGRSQHLQEQFGSEYDRAVTGSGRREGEKELQNRTERVESMEIRELEPVERQEFSGLWKNVQADFVDEPATAILEADELVVKVMAQRGYPMSDFDQRAADLSVNYPEVVSNYRAAHAVSESHRRSPRTTEELRQAMIHYRALFADLLGEVPMRG